MLFDPVRPAALPRVLPLFAAILLSLGACSPSTAPPPPAAHEASFSQSGMASWYGAQHAGNKTADGERFDPQEMTAAHRSLPFDTIARVTNVQTGKTVKVRITDRGPYEKDRVIDVSASAAAALAIHKGGVTPVRIEVFASDQPPTQASFPPR